MKISNSKKQLARIIHENGGWLGGTFSVMCRGGTVLHSLEKPVYDGISGWGADGGFGTSRFTAKPFAGWHQTILSRDEYFHLYQMPTTAAAPAPVAEVKQTIEQLAADYRNRKDYADRKQQEADAAKADAEAKLSELVAAGKALGLVLSVAGAEPGLVVTDWRLLQEDDVVWYGGDDEISAGEYSVMAIESPYYDGCLAVLVDNRDGGHWIDTSEPWRFIHRPTKGDANA